MDAHDSPSILILENDPAVRSELCMLLQQIPRATAVHEVSDGRTAKVAVTQYAPDIILIDIAILLIEGGHLTSLLKGHRQSIAIIALITSINENELRRAIKAGASGFLTKDTGIAELKIAIEAIARGHGYITPLMVKPVLETFRHEPERPDVPAIPLTKRHREILDLIIEGKTNKEVAHLLRISIKTVEKHR